MKKTRGENHRGEKLGFNKCRLRSWKAMRRYLTSRTTHQAAHPVFSWDMVAQLHRLLPHTMRLSRLVRQIRGRRQWHLAIYGGPLPLPLRRLSRRPLFLLLLLILRRLSRGPLLLLLPPIRSLPPQGHQAAPCPTTMRVPTWLGKCDASRPSPLRELSWRILRVPGCPQAHSVRRMRVRRRLLPGCTAIQNQHKTPASGLVGAWRCPASTAGSTQECASRSKLMEHV
mmetsp:Transcript_30083/g.79453  ORF Transcript_30083/g.79453 Transcript_30083/m.79453 type:complete len:227 (+) Transcript_30083:480-1160(+)